jgi:hypothetical protein
MAGFSLGILLDFFKLTCASGESIKSALFNLASGPTYTILPFFHNPSDREFHVTPRTDFLIDIFKVILVINIMKNYFSVAIFCP